MRDVVCPCGIRRRERPCHRCSCGRSFSGKRTPAGGSFRDAAGGGAVKLVDGYTAWGTDGKTSAKPFLFAESGVPLAFSHDVGRGRVVTVAVRRMLPDFM